MSGLGGSWNGEDNFSAARMNNKTIWIGTSTQLANLSPTYAGQIAVSTTTGSGFSANAVYYRDADNETWLFLSMSKHTHDADDNLSGGLYADILYDNAIDNYYLNYINLKKENLFSIIGGAATIVNDLSSASGKVVIDTGTVANDYGQLVDYGTRLGFDRKSRLIVKAGVTFGGGSVTNYIARIGVAGEDINGSNTTSNKYGIEACSQDSQVNWMIYSANAGIRTGGTVTSSPVDAGFTSAGIAYRLDHTPSVSILFYNNGVNCGPNCTKTSNNPNSGNTGTDYILRLGIKSTNTASKKMGLFGIRLVGKINDTSWK